MGGEGVWNGASHGKIEIWASAFCIAEVYKVKCEGDWTAVSPENDGKINNLFEQDWVKIVQLDSEIAKLAKKLLRTHEKLKKPSDAIHLATAIYWDVDQLHTYDGSDLLGLTVQTANGKDLKICKPDEVNGEDLFTQAKGGDGG